MEVVNKDWFESANCATTDPEVMFPEKGGRGAKMARKVCDMCLVQEDCLVSALIEGDFSHGIRAGLSGKQRKELAKAEGFL